MRYLTVRRYPHRSAPRSRRLVARPHAALGGRYGAPGKGDRSAAVAAARRTRSACALSATGGILHRRFEDAVGGSDSCIISVTFPDSALEPQCIFERHFRDALERMGRGFS